MGTSFSTSLHSGLSGHVEEMRLASRDVCDEETWANTVLNRSLCSVSERLHLLACELLPVDGIRPARERSGKKLEFASRDMVRVFHTDDEDEVIVDLNVDLGVRASSYRRAVMDHLDRDGGPDLEEEADLEEEDEEEDEEEASEEEGNGLNGKGGADDVMVIDVGLDKRLARASLAFSPLVHSPRAVW